MESLKKFCYEYPRPALTTDCVLLGFHDKGIKVLLIERKDEPFKGKWAFPGGFVDMDETTLVSANRELYEETGLENIPLKQLHTFSDLNRDPRGRVVSVVYYTFQPLSFFGQVRAGDDAVNVKWVEINEMPDLAFDHNVVLNFTLKKIGLNV